MTLPGYVVLLNILITLIWWIIPWCINLCRHKYNLPPKMVIWPLKNALFVDIVKSDFEIIIAMIITMTVAGIVFAVPIMTACIIYTIVRWCVSKVAFSKEEKVQIAIGTIEKTPK